MDTDAVAPVGSHEQLFERFRKEKIPFLVGTQMVTKGLNFENVTLVGVLSADQSLYAGDYRAGERTFSLITQVVGRSGRGTKPGRAVIQTFTPDNETIQQAGRYVRELLEAAVDPRDASFLGPVPLNVVKVNNRYRYRLHIRCRGGTAIRAYISQAVIACSTDKRFRGVSVFAENDPPD